ncbi:hypothetical protein TruAng_009166 [Truncatella angustata]|nr:hypothetical protein TruAng_009166 [Truncatella angustata]
MVGEIFGGPKDEDEDELSDDSDEYMSDDVDEEDNDEQSTSSEVDDGEDQANMSGECDEEEEDDDDDFFDEDDFSDSESNEGRNGSHSSHMVTCPDGLPPSSDLTYVGSYHPLYTPITTISPVILGKSDTGGNNGDGDGDGDGDGTSLCSIFDAILGKSPARDPFVGVLGAVPSLVGPQLAILMWLEGVAIGFGGIRMAACGLI